MEDSDFELVQRTLSGDDEAFARLVQRHQRSVYNLGYRMMGTREDAEDVTQETFLAAYRHLKSYDKRWPFKNWLLSIAHNKCVDWLRKSRPQYDLDGLEDAKARVEEMVLQKERSEMIQSALQKLPFEDRAVVVLKYWEGMSYKEIAETLNVNEGSVRNRLYRARKALAEMLKEAVS